MSQQEIYLNLSTVEAAQIYTGQGLALVPLRPNTKAPARRAWNTKEQSIRNCDQAKDYWSENPDHGIGLAHAYSEPITCALDIDNLSETRERFLESGLDLDELLSDPNAMRISSGQENRAKLIYILPQDHDAFESFTTLGAANKVAFEMRCAVKGSKTAQDVLPPSIHPTTKRPYTWLTTQDGLVIPKPPSGLLETLLSNSSGGKEATPSLQSRSTLTSYQFSKISSALASIPPDIDYESWLGIGMGLHSTGDHLNALELFNTWSKKGGKFKDGEPADKWRSFDERDDGIKLGTLFHIARQHGWEQYEFAKTFFSTARDWTVSEIESNSEGIVQYKDDFPLSCGRLKKSWVDNGLVTKTGLKSQEAQIRNEWKETKALESSSEEYRVVAELNKTHAVVPHGGSVVIVNEQEDQVSGGKKITFSKEHDLNLLYKNKQITTVRRGKTAEISFSNLWLEHPKRRQYKGIVFDPGKDRPGYLNLFKGWAVDPKPGRIDWFLDFIKEVICDNHPEISEYVLDWLSHLFQKPGELPEVAIALRSGQGYGKNTFGDAIGSLLGHHYIALTDMKQLTGNFNSHLLHTLLVFGNEALWSGDKSSHGTLKSMITDRTAVCEAKFQDAITVANFKRVIVASNEDWVVPADWDDRRWLIVDVSDCRKQDTKYFGAIKSKLDEGGREALLYYLLNRSIENFQPRAKPKTDAAFSVKLQSADPLDRWVFDLLSEGEIEHSDSTYYQTVTPLGEDGPTRVSTQEIYAAYKQALASGRRQNQIKSRHAFNQRFSELTGAFTCRMDCSGTRRRALEIPPLQVARRHFQDAISADSDIWES